jgi:hypothetical protein
VIPLHLGTVPPIRIYIQHSGSEDGRPPVESLVGGFVKARAQGECLSFVTSGPSDAALLVIRKTDRLPEGLPDAISRLKGRAGWPLVGTILSSSLLTICHRHPNFRLKGGRGGGAHDRPP